MAEPRRALARRGGGVGCGGVGALGLIFEAAVGWESVTILEVQPLVGG